MGATGSVNNINYNNLNADGVTNEDGSITMRYLHITNQTSYFGSQFGQDLEPKGEYMSYISPMQQQIDQPNYHYGLIHFENPLLLEHKSTGSNGWKKDLSEMYDGKTGKALSEAVKADGYDAIVTWEEWRGQRSWSEIVNLKSKKKFAT